MITESRRTFALGGGLAPRARKRHAMPRSPDNHAKTPPPGVSTAVVRPRGQHAALAALGLEAVRTSDLERLFGLAIDTLRVELGAQGAAVVEALPDGVSLTILALAFDDPAPPLEALDRFGTLVGLALQSDEPVITDDFASDSRLAPANHHFVSGIAAPIRRQQGNFGAISVASTAFQAFSDSDVAFVGGVANVLSGAIERAETLELTTATIAAISDVLVIVDDEATIIEANPAAGQLMGVEPWTLIGTKATLMAKHLEDGEAGFAVVLAGGTGSTWIARPDGELRLVEFSAVANIRPGLHLVIARDVTEKRALEQEVLQTQRLDLVGVLAAGIAHDFSNLLIAVRGLSGVVLEELDADSPLRPDMEAIHAAGIRGIALVKRLLAFARPPDIAQAQVVSTTDVVMGMTQLLERFVRADIALEITSETSASVLVDPVDLEQAVLNLVVNAHDSIAGRGTIRIEIDAREITPAEALEIGIPPDRYARVSVRDDGRGMDQATQARAVDPFFTTKEPGRGTGLGLPMAQRVARGSGGALTIESELERGTVVTLFLPVVDGAPEPHNLGQPPVPSPRGDETILVVDDNELALRFSERALERLGYTVFATSSASEALAILAAHPEIAAAVLDVVMPELSGHELAELARQTHPGLPVSFISAYSTDQRSDVLWKPFTEGELGREVRSSIDAEA